MRCRDTGGIEGFANPMLAHPYLFNVEACKHGRMSSGMKRLTRTSIAAAKQEAIEAAEVAADTVSAGAFLGPGGSTRCFAGWVGGV
jgi:hypothetical protein